MFHQKYILIALAFFIIASFSYLAILENNQHQIKNSWFLYFENITDNSPNFMIENYSENTDFSWEIFADDILVQQNTAQILNKNKKSVTIDKPLGGQSIKIIVSHSEEKKEIYKNFE